MGLFRESLLARLWEWPKRLYATPASDMFLVPASTGWPKFTVADMIEACNDPAASAAHELGPAFGCLNRGGSIH